MTIHSSWTIFLKTCIIKHRHHSINLLDVKIVEIIQFLLTSGAGLPLKTLHEKLAGSPSFTTSFSGVTEISGRTDNEILVKMPLGFYLL